MRENEMVSLNIVVREENMGKKKVFIVNNEDLGVADFGDTLDSAIENFKKSVELFLDAYPEKREELKQEGNQHTLQLQSRLSSAFTLRKQGLRNATKCAEPCLIDSFS